MLAGLSSNWSSHDTVPAVSSLPATIKDAYRYSVAEVAHFHGRGLVLLIMSLISVRPFGDGVSEREILDALSLDDDLLQRIYQYHIPPTRRLPHLVLVRVLEAMGPLLAEREGAGGVPVHSYHHRLLWEAASSDGLLPWEFAQSDTTDDLLTPGHVASDMETLRPDLRYTGGERAESEGAAARELASQLSSMRFRASALLAVTLSGLAKVWFPARQVADSPDWFTSVHEPEAEAQTP